MKTRGIRASSPRTVFVAAALGLTLVLVSHDLSVVRHMCDRVVVMRAGEVVETGATRSIFREPRHPYTRALLASIPRLRNRRAASTDSP